MAESLDDKVLGFEGRDLAYPASGAAIGISLDYFNISDRFVNFIYDKLSPVITEHSGWAPSLDALVSTPLIDIVGMGSFVAAAAGSARGVLLSWATPIAYGLAKATFDYGAGAYVGASLGSIAAGLFLPITAFAGAGLLAGYTVRAIYKFLS
ncbi:MAG: hypothetical protein AABW46_00220, partial [Nanoarchaeota archaeon]